MPPTWSSSSRTRPTNLPPRRAPPAASASCSPCPKTSAWRSTGTRSTASFETLMAVDGDPAPIDFHREGYLWLGSGKRDVNSLIANWRDPDRARCPRRIARPQGRQAPLPVDAGRRHRHRRLLAGRRLHGPAQRADGISPQGREPGHPLPEGPGRRFRRRRQAGRRGAARVGRAARGRERRQRRQLLGPGTLRQARA